MSQGNENKEGELEGWSKVRNVNLGEEQQTMVGSF